LIVLPNALQKIDKGLWRLESDFVVWGCKGSVRMTVIETERGLVIYSPVHLSKLHVASIRQIGDVATIIAPNLYHHFYLRACIAHFPSARILIPAGLTDKIGALDKAVVATEATDFGAGEELDFHIFGGHSLRETMLFHRPTGTLITADLLYNFRPEHFKAEKAFFRLIGCYGAPSVPFYHRFAVENRESVRAMIERIRGWPIRRIVMCHGRIVEGDASREIFAGAWMRFS
jgi:hypothetical protein